MNDGFEATHLQEAFRAALHAFLDNPEMRFMIVTRVQYYALKMVSPAYMEHHFSIDGSEQMIFHLETWQEKPIMCRPCISTALIYALSSRDESVQFHCISERRRRLSEARWSEHVASFSTRKITFDNWTSPQRGHPPNKCIHVFDDFGLGLGLDDEKLTRWHDVVKSMNTLISVQPDLIKVIAVVHVDERKDRKTALRNIRTVLDTDSAYYTFYRAFEAVADKRPKYKEHHTQTVFEKYMLL